jgi:hexulose-6-phosphate isomerase
MTIWPKSITLRAFPPDQPLERCLAVARDAGFDAVEVNLEPGLSYTLESTDAEIRSLGSLVAKHGLRISALYSREQWSFPITSSDPMKVERGTAIIRRLSECATLLGVDAVLVVPGAVDNSAFSQGVEITPYDVAYQRATEILAALASELEQEGHQASLCIENVWNKFLLSPLEMRQFIDEIDHPLVAVYFDVGNILQYGFPDQWIDILGHRIRRVHVKDFHAEIGNQHGFTALLQGDVDWPAVVSALVRIDYRSYLTAEVLPPYKHDPFQLVYDSASAIDAIMAMASDVPRALVARQGRDIARRTLMD